MTQNALLKSRISGIIMLTLPGFAWGGYDVDEIKNRLSSHTEFEIHNWIPAKNNQGWAALTNLKNSTINVSEKKTNITLPFINPPQKNTAKKLCASFSAKVLNTTKQEDLDLIHETIRVATTRHQIKLATFDNVKLFIQPKLVGMRVSLHCYLKPKS